jgi:hypothetical protein
MGVDLPSRGTPRRWHFARQAKKGVQIEHDVAVTWRCGIEVDRFLARAYSLGRMFRKLQEKSFFLAFSGDHQDGTAGAADPARLEEMPRDVPKCHAKRC